MVKFDPLAAKIGLPVWGTPGAMQAPGRK